MAISSLGKTIIDILENGNEEDDWKKLLVHPREEFRAWAISMIQDQKTLSNVVLNLSETQYIRKLALLQLKVAVLEEIYDRLPINDPLREYTLDWYVSKRKSRTSAKLRNLVKINRI